MNTLAEFGNPMSVKARSPCFRKNLETNNMSRQADRHLSILLLTAWVISCAGCSPGERETAKNAATTATAADSAVTSVEPNSTSTVSAGTSSEAIRLYPDIESQWNANQQSRARSMFADRQYDVLVVPFQVRGHGFDATTRSLMFLSLASAIANQTNLSVADLVLVAKSLGSNARQFSDAQIADLAEDLGVSLILLGDVGHNRHGKFEVRVRFAEPDGPARLSFRDDDAFERSDIPFGDTDLPYYAFLEMRDDIVRKVTTSTHDEPPALLTEHAVDLPPDIATLAASMEKSPLVAVHYLQFLGTLPSPSMPERTNDMLFERSLVLLENIDPKSTDYRLLKSRALLYLNRRPAALAALKDPESAAEKALMALLNGNIVLLKEAIAEIESPLLATIAGLESERLRMEYSGSADDELLGFILDSHETWGTLLYHSYSASNSWRQFTHIPLKMALDTTFPEKRFSFETHSAGKVATGGYLDEYDLALLIFRHIRSIEDLAAMSPPDSPLPIGPRMEDFADLVRNMLVSDVYDKVRHAYSRIGKPRSGVEIADRYEPLLAGHPSLAYVRSQALGYLKSDSTEPEKSNLEKRSLALARQSLFWTGGINADTVLLTQYSGWFMPDYRQLPEETRLKLTFASDWPTPAAALRTGTHEERQASFQHCLDYTVSDFQCLVELHGSYWRSQDGKGAASALVSRNQHRFIGHPQRLEFLAGHLLRSGDVEASDRVYYDAIEAKTSSWIPYERIGRKHLLESRVDKALEIVEQYPGFHESTIASRVALSNYAYDFGSLMYWAGAYEAATPLYERAASYQTGSAAGMSSAARLALIRGDYQTAVEETLRRVQRYESKYAIRDLIGLAVIMGDTDAAWMIVEGSLDKLSMPEIWTGALIAHRASNTELTDIVDWAFSDGKDDIGGEGASLALRYVFLAHTIDRSPSDSLPELIRRRDPRPRPIRKSSGLLVDAGKPLGRPDFFAPRVVALHESQQQREVDRLLTFASEALIAIEKKDYTTAFNSLDEASRYYNLGEFLPYYSWAAAKIGDTERLENYLEESMREKSWTRQNAKSSTGIFFDDYLAKAFLYATKGEHAKAIETLRKTNSDVLHNQARHVFTRYQIIETARLLFNDTADERYQDFALDLARRNTVIEPIQAYTHSFVAMLSPSRAERITALARVLLLDPQSRCLDTAKDSELTAARKLAEGGYPMPGDSIRLGI